MSAICGIVRFDDKPVNSAELESMVGSSPYRGPDGIAYHLQENAGFAHMAFHVTPESILEKQPLLSEKDRLVLVADVRLDNSDELLGKLDLRLGPDRVVTDPELILFAYRKWGNACVEHLLGDFVFSIWDTGAKTLFLARDPLGAYSVTYHQAGKCFVFASETTAILDLPFVEPVINEERVLREIEFLPRGHEDTFFKSIFYLPPAHCMEISSTGHRLWKYWDIDPGFHTAYRTDDEYADHLLELVDRATACRMRCIGPVGISLSGGHDSTLVAASAARQLSRAKLPQRGLMSFSYVFDRFKECDEREYIEPVVEQYGLDAHYIQGDDLWSFRHLKEYPVPKDYLWTNCFVNLPLSVARSARHAGCRLLLSGHAGDALFGGSSLAVADMLSRGQVASLFSYLQRHAADINWLSDVILHGFGPLAPKWIRKLYRKARGDQTNTYINGLSRRHQELVKKIRKLGQLPPVPEELTPGAKTRYRSALNPVWSQGFAATRSPGYNKFGIEEVSPLYDRRIVEFMLSVPSDRIIQPGKPRFLQSNAMKRVLPGIVCNRTRKTSFVRLLRTGLIEKENKVVRALLQNPLIVRRGWVNPDWLETQLAAGDSLESSGYPLSNCLHLELWLRAINEKTGNKKRWSVTRPPLI